MSGGSFDYLCSKELEHFVSYQVDPHLVERMAEELDDLGFASLAAETRAVMAYATSIRDEMEKKIQALAGAWKGVEWYRSNDHSREQAVLACAQAHIKLHPQA